jgi:hypothetical protein
MALEVARNRRGTTIAGGDVNGGGEMPHLRIITRDYLNETRYRTRLGDFLDELFEGMSPLRVANMERSTYQGRTVVLVNTRDSTCALRFNVGANHVPGQTLTQ